MIVGVGHDILEVARMRRELAKVGAGLRDDVFTPDEIADCARHARPERQFAARFAAKEAFWKALGTGVLDWSAWREVEVVTGPRGEPTIALHGRAKALAAGRDVRRVHVSLSQDGRLAAAALVLEDSEGACPKT